MENELPNTYIYGHRCDEFQWHLKEEKVGLNYSHSTSILKLGEWVWKLCILSQVGSLPVHIPLCVHCLLAFPLNPNPRSHS